MSVREEFDDWATDGRDKGMEERHWHTAKHVLARMPIEAGETVLDLGTGSGYALRALKETKSIGRGYGLDGSPEMAANAADYTDDDSIGFLIGDFDSLPFADNSVDHVFTMEAFYYAADPAHTLEELQRIIRPGGAVYCAVNYYEENVASHSWQDNISVAMTRWSRDQYRDAFREAGFHVAEQDTIPDLEIEIPPESAFPTDRWETRDAMIDRYRTWGTLLTVGVVP
ncbi:class I SAM-dependent methyltransferase [Natronocalculus amylovorans]|uniref:Class I SAM-dependent methyltransferase n=1 Tax=Natronocalculus amylovorans TaxID=2917812 RepID=A0AAE3K823_9EURY|nr:class I SAM-dependent methyltransferase [Natronocalculus amylovorans]MCL9816055.1 class I SAM-dependent methyltransferase [Natronocalculus amylovorans]